MHDVIGAAWRPPFSMDAATYVEFPVGASLAEMADGMGLPAAFPDTGVICINGHVIDRAVWRVTRPKASRPGQEIAVTFHMPLHGGGGDSGKGTAILALVATLAFTAVGGFIATQGLTIGGISVAGGTASAQALGAAVSIGGSLALSFLTAPPTPTLAGGDELDETRREAAAISGNALEPGGSVARVAGTYKVFPSHLAFPLVDLVGEDEVVEAVCGLAGPHELMDIRVADAPIDEAEDIEYETREGWRGDAPISIIQRQGRTTEYQTTLSLHDVEESLSYKLTDQSVPANALPVSHTFSGRDSPDEIWMSLILPEGLHDTDAPTNQMAIPFRFQIRKRGESTWVNLPEVHYQDAHIGTRRLMVRLKWQDEPETPYNPPTNRGFVYAHINVPGQTIAPVADGWVAHSHFDKGSGNDYVSRSEVGGSAVQNIRLEQNECTFYLDEGTFPKGIYDIRVKRGMFYDASDFTKSTYQFSGTVYDLFGYYLSGDQARIFEGRGDAGDTVTVLRVASVWNEHPIAKPGYALIALKATGRRVERISTVASGYVPDWSGTAWDNWTKTSNPAPHFRYVLNGAQTPDSVPMDLLDDDSLVAWRAGCIANGWTCDAVFQGDSSRDVLRILASSGYARLYQSETYGVIQDKDRSSDSPVQIFGPRNMAGFTWSNAFARRPDGLRVKYPDSTSDYDETEIIVYASDYAGGDGGRFEEITYRGLVTEADARTRAVFDQEQARLRNTFYAFDAPAEAIVCRRGDLIGVNHDVLVGDAKHTAAARIADVIRNSGQVEKIVLDGLVQVYDEDDLSEITDMSTVMDWSKIGLKSGVAIRRTDGSVTTHAISNPTGMTDTLTLATPVASSTIGAGCLVHVGPVGEEYKRLLVLDITNKSRDGDNLIFGITAVDEAQELVRT